jgi:hypothetical protein
MEGEVVTEYYRGPCCRITDEVFESRSPGQRSFVISELGSVYVIDGAGGSRLGTVRACSTALAGLAAIAAATSGGSLLEWGMVTAGALVVLVVATVVAVIAWRTRVRPHELWGAYRGELVCLFQSTDRLEFGQVRRALIRVFEQIADAR